LTKLKAHPRVLAILLQVLDEGRLTDSKGRTVDFTNTVIILTSNIGAELLLEAATQSPEKKTATHKLVMDQVRASFAPEFLNRLNSIVMFNALGASQMERIVQKAMSGVKRRLESKGIGVVLERSGAKAILESSYDTNYGARPVERYLEGTVVTELSRMLISGEIASSTTVHIECADDIGDEDSSLDDCNHPLAKRARTLRYRVENEQQSDAMADNDKNSDICDRMEC
jgi:ATP-dependent Clp protease ATP-binding subunit ClpB